MHFLNLIVFALIINCIKTEDCDSSHPKSVESRLRKDVFCNYDQSTRPVLNRKNSTQVTVRMVLKTLDFNEHSDEMSIHSWIVLTWKDEHLHWKKSDYDQIEVIQVESSKLWVPDLSLYNANGDGTSGFSTTCLLYSTGTIVCVPPITHSAVCSPDLTRWPFDIQNCTFRFGSWVHTGEEIDYQLQGKKAISTDDYQENRNWHLKQVNVSRHHGKYNCCPDDTFPSLRYSFVIERHSGTYTVQYLIPAMVLVMINLVALWIDAGVVERVILVCVNLFCHFTFTQQLAWIVPANGDTCPLVVLFFRDSILITSAVLILTIAARRLLTKTNEPPGWMISSSNYLLRTKAGQLFLLNELDPQAVASEMDGGADDGASLVISKHNENLRPKEWRLSVVLLDRVSFIIILLAYFAMFMSLLP